MSGSTKDLYDTLGALYLGATITMSLWGIAMLQTYYYYNRYVKDAIWIKLLVFLIWAFDTVHQALILKSVYVYLVTNYNNPQFLANSESTIDETAVFSILVTEIVHLFLLFRIWILSKKNTKLTLIFAVVISLEIVFSILDLNKTLHVKQFADVKSYAWLVKVYLSIIAATDTSIALALIILLHRSRTGFEKSDNIINRLIVFTVNTGAIPSLISLLSTAMIAVYPDNLIWFSLYTLISKVYTNTLLATLNSRAYSTESLHSTVCNSIPKIIKAKNNDISMTIRVDTNTSHRADDINLEESKTEALGLKAASVDLV